MNNLQPQAADAHSGILQEIEYAAAHGWPTESMRRLEAMCQAPRRASPTAQPAAVLAHPPQLTAEQIRAEFEVSVRGSKLKATTPLASMTVNGVFSHYTDPDTDTLWLGYRAGFVRSMRLAGAAPVDRESVSRPPTAKS